MFVMGRSNEGEARKAYNLEQGAKVLALLEIVFGFILAFLSVLLAVAVIKDRRRLLLPYVIGVLTYQVFDISTLLFYVGKDVKIYSSVWIPDILILLVDIYCGFIVLSFYVELGRRHRRQPILQYSESDDD